MSPLPELQLLPPSNWTAFERLCHDLWKSIWKDSATKRHGRSGQAQHGVDVYGRPNCGKNWAGVQCKGKDNYADKLVTDKELRSEAEAAKAFEPALSEFILATTARRDAQIQKSARLITTEHLDKELFTVDVWSWDDILEELVHHPDVIKAHYHEYALTATIEAGFKDVGVGISELQASNTTILARLDTASSFGVTSIFDSQLDYTRELIRTCKPSQALGHLESLKSQIWSQAPKQVRARHLSLTGYAKLALGDEPGAAALFIESYQYAPDEERVICNCALGFLLQNEGTKAADKAREALARNDANSQARSILVQTLDLPFDQLVEQIPKSARTDSQIAFAVAHVARLRGDLLKAEEWYRTALVNDKEDQSDVKGMVAQVVLEQILSNRTSSTALGIPNAKDKSRLDEAVALLTKAWNATASDAAFAKARVAWIVNRGVAHRFLGQHELAADDFELALQFNSQNGFAAHHLSLEYFSLGQFDKALAIISGDVPAKEFKGARVLVGEVLRRAKGLDPAIEHLIALASNPADDDAESARQSLVEMLLERNATNDLDLARTECDKLLALTPQSIEALAMSSQIHSRSGMQNEAKADLEKAHQQLSADTLASHVVILADEAYRQKQYQIATDAYERIAVTDYDNPYIRQALRANLFLGKDGRALELCERIKAGQGATDFTCEVETVIFERRGPRERAKDACEAWLRLTPDDGRVKIRLGVLNCRLNEMDKVDALLDAPPDWIVEQESRRSATFPVVREDRMGCRTNWLGSVSGFFRDDRTGPEQIWVGKRRRRPERASAAALMVPMSLAPRTCRCILDSRPHDQRFDRRHGIVHGIADRKRLLTFALPSRAQKNRSVGRTERSWEPRLKGNTDAPPPTLPCGSVAQVLLLCSRALRLRLVVFPEKQ